MTNFRDIVFLSFLSFFFFFFFFFFVGGGGGGGRGGVEKSKHYRIQSHNGAPTTEQNTNLYRVLVLDVK